MSKNKFPVTLNIIKKGEMIYFSQLDLSLALKRALRRSGLPNYFTQGFRPHIKISFQGALKLGKEAQIKATFYFTQKVLPEELLKQLGPQLPQGLSLSFTN